VVGPTRGMHLVSLAPPPDMRGVRGWRAATSAPLTYRIGASSLHFRSHLLLAAILALAAVTTIAYLSATSFTRPALPSTTNISYPRTPAVRVAGGTRWRIAVVEDGDQASKLEGRERWRSRLRYGALTLTDAPAVTATVEWEEEEVELVSSLAAGGRGMELSELCMFQGQLLTVDDRTGVVYRVEGSGVEPWVILADGDGRREKGLKAEWMAVVGEELWLGGLGKEWTDQQGELLNHDQAPAGSRD